MSDEIKEIDRIIINVKRKLQFSPERRFVELFDKGDIKQLLDYITTLQEENEYLKKHQRFHKKFGNEYIFCVEDDKETYKDLLLEKQEESEDYKSRIEKAVEYIKTCYIDELQENCILLNKKEVNNLLNILNGDEDE